MCDGCEGGKGSGELTNKVTIMSSIASIFPSKGHRRRVVSPRVVAKNCFLSAVGALELSARILYEITNI